MKLFILTLVLLSFSFVNCTVHSRADALSLQNVRATPFIEPSNDKELPFSPFEIKELAAKQRTLDISPLWNRLGLDVDSFEFVGRYEFDAASASIDDDNLDDAVLVVWIAALAKVRIVLLQQQAVFNRPQEQWKFVGYIDIADQQYGAPEYQVVNGTRKKLLVVKELTGRGTGVSSYEDRWYEIKSGELKSVLNYVSKGHDINNRLGDRTFSAKITAYSDIEVEVEFTVDWESIFFEDLPDYKATISQSKKAYYTWDESKHQFVFNKSKSQITEQEIENVYNFDTITDDSYLKYMSSDFIQIAENGEPKQKQWLSLVLDKLADSPQKRQLKKALEKK